MQILLDDLHDNYNDGDKIQEPKTCYVEKVSSGFKRNIKTVK